MSRGWRSLAADLLRLPWAALAWNSRKTIFRLRGGRGRCPCQHPSDSGAAHETGCDACVEWSEPARFRWVCPLLVPGAHGWHCSVRAADVRPYWIRAALLLAGLALAAHGVAATLLLVGFRATGVDEARWLDVAWPGRWHEISKARARTFCVRAAQRLQRYDFPGAELSIASALELDPENYDAALFLAGLRQYQNQLRQSDALYRRLLDKFPERTAQSAIAWHDALLQRQRLADVADLSLQMAARSGPQLAWWMKSALFAARTGGGATEIVRRNADLIGALPRTAAVVLEAEALWQRGERRGAVELLLDTDVRGVGPLLLGEYLEQLLRCGERDRAEVFWRRHGGAFTAFERAFYRLRIDQVSGDPALVRLSYAELLKLPITPSSLDRLTAWLIEFPDRRSFDRLQALMREPGNQAAMAGAELWLAALQCGAKEEAAGWERYCAKRLNLRVAAIPAVDFASDQLGNPASVSRQIATGRLPREVIFSLIRRAAAERQRARADLGRPADAGAVPGGK